MSGSFEFLGGELKNTADETLFLELALRGYNLSGLLRDKTETDETTAEIVKIGNNLNNTSRKKKIDEDI